MTITIVVFVKSIAIFYCQSINICLIVTGLPIILKVANHWSSPMIKFSSTGVIIKIATSIFFILTVLFSKNWKKVPQTWCPANGKLAC